MAIALTKHHGLGNDFLVLLDPWGVPRSAPELARAACDRHRGIGADGLIRVTAGSDGADVTMHLFNADGSRAEISGNGLGCLTQAVLQAGLAPGPVVTVRTDAGVRAVLAEAGSTPRRHRMTVQMGEAIVVGEEPEWLDDDVLRAARVEIGNPHLVLHVPDPDTKLDLESRGRMINEHVPGGINVEAVWTGPGEGELTMAVYERGVGLTEACGSGACAVAAAARAWDLAGDTVRVHMPGGPSDVALGPPVRLSTVVEHIATIDFPWP
jgi:diaminopimelate epimerase